LTEQAIKILKKPNAEKFIKVIVDKYTDSSKKSLIRDDERGDRRRIHLVKQKKNMDIHAIQLKIPIKKGKINLKKYGGRVNKEFRNWIPEYLDIYQPLNLTLRNNNNKSISVFVGSHRIFKLSDILTILSHTQIFIYRWFLDRGVELDLYRSAVINTDLWRQDKFAEEKLRKGDRIKVKFDKLRAKLTPNDPNQPSIAMFDTSPRPGRESNDIDYAYAELRMPFNIESILEILKEQSYINLQQLEATKLEIENKKLHRQVLVDIKKSVAESTETNKKTLEFLKELSNALPQNRLKNSKSALLELKSMIKKKTDVLKFSDLVNILTTEDKYLLTDWLIKKFD